MTHNAGLGAWLPIETAPKDGTEILVYTMSECFYVVAYDDVFSAPWRIRNNEGLNEAVPTHWMPLPDATNDQAQGWAQGSSRLSPGAAGSTT